MQTIEITLDLSEIIYDIQNKTYLTGKCRRSDSNHELVANMQANDDDENANQVLRSISMAYAMLKTKLGEYLQQTVTKSSNTLIDTDARLSLSLRMPSNYNLATLDTITAAAHQYIVSSAVVDWFTITHKTDAPEYTLLAESSLKTMIEAVSKRCRPLRRIGKE
ncbi:MAG: hypothetical protein K2J82_07935 [Muribaculaceae bacterium]|nr:hypothetical protein [Muribaculaceae bacterium]MDE6754526.1 hypothetical protein [Muribaculaceae bacterium]